MDHISGLAAELRDIFTSYITHPGDLKSLCLTCKTLRDSAIPKLYYRYTLNLDDIQADDSFFRQGHSGHEHIRQLIITCDGGRRRRRRCRFMETQEDVQEEIRLVLRLLPQDKLDSLHTPKDLHLDRETLDLIFTTQQNLKYMQLGPMHSAALPSTLPSRHTFEKLQGLEIPKTIGSEQDLDFYGGLLSAHSNIKCLSIRACRYYRERVSPGGFFSREDVPTNDYRTLSAIFKHLRQTTGSSPTPLALDSLRLCHQRLLWADYNLTRYIAFEKLLELQIHECREIGNLLSSLAKRFHSTRPGLKLFSLRVDSLATPDIESVRAFLTSFGGLQYLEIGWFDRYLPACVNSLIATHMPTLKDLYLNFVDPSPEQGEPRRWVMRQNDVSDLLANSPNLRQIALRLPQISPSNASDNSQLWQSLDLLLFSSSKNILRILNWPPVYSRDERLHDSVHLSYMRKVDAFASQIFQKIVRDSRPSALELLIIGDARVYDDKPFPQHCEGLLDMRCACYLPVTQTNASGQKEVVAMAVPPEKIRYEHPFWDAITTTPRYVDNRLGAADYRLIGRMG